MDFLENSFPETDLYNKLPIQVCWQVCIASSSVFVTQSVSLIIVVDKYKCFIIFVRTRISALSCVYVMEFVHLCVKECSLCMVNCQNFVENGGVVKQGKEF